MPKTANQKTRILELYRFLLRESSEEHPLTVAEIGEHLEAIGMPANRKTVMDDLHALSDAGVDLLSARGKGGGYFIGAREFESAELKLLIDAVQSSRFISESKSRALIGKLLGQTSRHEEKHLGRSVYVAGRVKSENTELFYTVDVIHTAILSDRSISFLYYDWTEAHRQEARHGGKRYLVSPCMLSWDNEFYYLLAYDGESDSLRHYRVDKMRKIRSEDTPRQGRALWERICQNPAAYENELFGKFAGEETTVLLSVDRSLAGVIVDRFGEDLPFLSDGDGAGTFRVSVKVRISPVFLSWVMQFGARMRILSPESVRREMRELAQKILDSHGEL